MKTHKLLYIILFFLLAGCASQKPTIENPKAFPNSGPIGAYDKWAEKILLGEPAIVKKK